MENILENEIKLENNLVNEKEQNNFLETTLGKTINTGIDIGIRALLPDYIEEQIIDLKDNLMKYGLKDGIKKSIDDAINVGKSAIGIVTGKFDNISQMQEAVKNGGIIDNVSYLLDDVINKVKNAGLINSTIANTIKKGKNSILNNVEKNIENNFNNQIKSLNYAENLYIFLKNFILLYIDFLFVILLNNYYTVNLIFLFIFNLYYGLLLIQFSYIRNFFSHLFLFLLIMFTSFLQVFYNFFSFFF